MLLANLNNLGYSFSEVPMKKLFGTISILCLVVCITFISCKQSEAGKTSQGQSASQTVHQDANVQTENTTASTSQGSQQGTEGQSAQGSAQGSSTQQATSQQQQGQQQGQTSPANTQQTPSQQDTVPRRKIGEIVFFDGTVTIARKGATVKNVQIGDTVYTFDVVTTGPKSKLEIDLAAGTPGGGIVKLTENTSFYFDTKVLDNGARKTVIQLLAGAVQVKVDKLANGSFTIATDAATLGVRGTLFIVDTIPDGTMMVTCAEGFVSVKTEDGDDVRAPAGSAVIVQDGNPVKKDMPPESLIGFRNDWRKAMYDAFASKALNYTTMYAGIVDSQTSKLLSALQKLRSHQAILDMWANDKASGKEPRFTDYMTEKKTIAPAIFEVLTALFAIERPYYRLLELKALHASGIGTGVMKDGRSTTAYFSDFDTKTQAVVTAMAEAREALKLFAWAAAGSPLGNFFGAKADSLGTGNLFFDEEF